MENCVFCDIIQGKEPERAVIFEDDTILAIKPRTEINPGHTLIIPKEHYENIFDIPADTLSKVVNISQQLAKTLKDTHEATAVNILHASGKDAGQSVFHFHFHVVPRYPNDGLNLWLERKQA